MNPREMTRTTAPIFLAGTHIYLRPLEPDDLNEAYLRWLNDPDVTSALETGSFPTTRAGLRQFYDRTALSPDNVFLAIIDRETDRHVGNIKLGPVNWLHRRADLGILIGEKEFWGRGIGREACALLIAYAFDRLNLHKITLGVYADHPTAVRLYRSLGFTVEGTLREHLYRDGYHDKYVMGLLRSDFVRQGSSGG